MAALMARRHYSHRNPGRAPALRQPAEPGFSEDSIVKWLRDRGLPETQEAETYVADIESMEAATGRTGLLSGFRLPTDVSKRDFFSLASEIDRLAADTGWRYYPTPDQLVWAARNGITSANVADWFTSLHPELRQRYPWLVHGETRQSYERRIESYQDVIEEQVGDRAGPDNSWIKVATDNRWSTEHLRQTFLQAAKNDPRWGYLKHGMNYSQWQQYKVENKQKVEQRFGPGAIEQQYLSDLDNPLQKFDTAGGAIGQLQQRQQTATDQTGYGSAVR